LLARGETRLLVGTLIDEPVLPLAEMTIPEGRVERGVAAEPAVHVNHIRFGDAEPPGDDLHLVGPHVALIEDGNLALRLAQVEEHPLLVGRGPDLHQRPRAQDVFLDRGLAPPSGMGAEPEALLGREAFERSHQTDIALGDQVRDRQAVAAIAHGDLGDQAQMAGNELVRRLAVAVPAPALGQQALLLRFQHREPADFLKITRQAGSSRHTLIWDCEPNHHLPRMYARSNTFEIKLSELDPLVKLISKHYYMPMS